MDTRFSHLRQRDASVSMLRVKMSRRRSQSQKENRERAVNTRRQLDKLLEVSSLDASIAVANMSTIQEKTLNIAKAAKSKAVEERLKQLERWKERKALEKEKEKRDREHKGIFKTGLYHPKNILSFVSLPPVQASSTRAKEAKVNMIPLQSSRVTRSMKQQQQVQKPLKIQTSNSATKKAEPAVQRSTRSNRGTSSKPAPPLNRSRVCPVEPVVRALSTRSVNRPPVAALTMKDKPKDKSAGVRTTRSRAIINTVAPSSGKGRDCTDPATLNNANVHPDVSKEAEMKTLEAEVYPARSTSPSDGLMEVDQASTVENPSPLCSFAPEGFVFQAPVGLSSFKFEPLTPRSADAFLTPSSSFSLPPAPVFNVKPQMEPNKPSSPKSPLHSPPHLSAVAAASTPDSPLESKHDVPYFRLQIVSETDRLTALCAQWESKVEDESIPEEMRDRMRTAVGQARLLMKERFNQFGGLVDDCELGRGEKITTCTDLQGFWDMVYYQVEDVNKKFDALKDAEAQGWMEEHKPPPRQRKAVKKPAAAPTKPTGAKAAAAAKSRLAAVKAAMKAKQQAEKAAKAAGKAQDEPYLSSEDPQPQLKAHPTDTVVFDGGFFQVESPAKASGSVRRSICLAPTALPQASPCSSSLSPRRVTRHSLALAKTPVQTRESPAQSMRTAHLRLACDQTSAETPKSKCGTPEQPQRAKGAVNVSLCFSPIKGLSSDSNQHHGNAAEQTGTPSAQDNTALAPEQDICMPVHSVPSIFVVQEEDEKAEAVDADPPLSPRLSCSPCKSPPSVCQAAEPSSALSFTMSPSRVSCQLSPSSPAAICSSDVQGPMVASESMCHTPDISVVEEIPGLDFERYLQPSQRCSLSPKETVAMETLSPMSVDLEMESPRGQSKDPNEQKQAQPEVPSMLPQQSPQAQTAESTMLLFTPNLNDRIRQSVCPADLMLFTPPL